MMNKDNKEKQDEDLVDDELINQFEEMSEDNDFILEKDYLSSLVDQKNNVLYYEVENIYSDLGERKYKNKYKLKKSPPVLIIRDEFDNESVFQLTENLTDELIGTLKEVQRAYLGFDGPKDINKPDKCLDRIVYSIKKKPLKLLLPFIILLMIIKSFL